MDARRADGPDANEIAKLVGPMWSEAKVCDALGIEAKALATRREEGTVLVPMMSDGVRAYPISQFQRTDGAIEVRPALIPFLTTLRHFDPWTVAVLLQTPAPELEDKTPFDWLGIGGDPKVLEDLARTVSSEWSAGSPAPGLDRLFVSSPAGPGVTGRVPVSVATRWLVAGA